MAIALETVDLAVDDGTTMTAHIARPASAAHAPGILVFQEAFGVNDHIKDVARRFAAEGFLAIAPEMYHRTGSGVVLNYGDMDAVKPHSSAVTTETIVADVKAAHAWLTGAGGAPADRIAAIGYCQGGRVTYVANATVSLSAAASYYGGGLATEPMLALAAKQRGPLLQFWGGKDKNIPPESYRATADALTAADKIHEQVVFSYAEHGFFCDARPSYNPHASRQAWALTLEFFRSQKVL
jgi:carboxymethylenebutenolidase